MPVVTGMELSEQDLAGFRELFDLVDKDRSGAIDAEEGRASLRNPNCKQGDRIATTCEL